MITIVIRYIGLYLLFLMTKIKYLGRVKFRGFTIIYAFPGCSIKFLGKGHIINNYSISNPFGLWQRSIFVAQNGGEITIGAGCGISGSTIYSMSSISIGENVIIGGNCKVIDNDFHPLHFTKRNPQRPEDIKRAPITIGDYCFIGANSIILKGTILGKNCVVGAGSVVHGNWPDNSIIAGNPARLIGENVLHN